jgi:hypothetical protein
MMEIYLTCYEASYRSAGVKPVSLSRSMLIMRVVFQKYRVGIMLPAKLGMSVIMLVGEAHTFSVAYKIAVMKAITDICEHKTENLLGTKFTHIPHDKEGEDPLRDSYKFVKRHPHAAAEHMDRCKHLLSMFYHIHGALVGDIQSLVEEIT